jgi:hypothetical protein
VLKLLGLLAGLYAGDVARLGSPDWRTREAAERALARAWPLSAPALWRAQAHDDPEVRRRAVAASRRGAARVLGVWGGYHWSEWPAVLVLAAGGDDPDGSPDAVLAFAPAAYLAAFARRHGLLDPWEALDDGGGRDDGAWWNWAPRVSVGDLRRRYRGE